jgi:putative oxidoreductase
MKYLVLLGRFFYVFIFLLAMPDHFHAKTIAYAAHAGVPLASLAVPLSGIIAFLGGLSILLGYKAKFGAWLIILFLVPVTLMMHKFWGLSDHAEGVAMMQQINFLKNTSMLGAAFLIAYFGAGPLSLDARGKPQG